MIRLTRFQLASLAEWAAALDLEPGELIELVPGQTRGKIAARIDELPVRVCTIYPDGRHEQHPPARN